ncbi:MAG TPA: asparaginase domain-containing protein [Magnetospirillaceae bacterium]|nr:asparaginase domain-containing protein [Magnetospirillaceae bacterium]
MIPVTILSLGGTILSRSGSSDPVPLARLHRPGMEAVSFVEVARLGSNALGFADIRALAADIVARHAEDPDQAFVLVQGTDTLEETSFLLDLLLPRAIPLVVTGAMRTSDALGADGPANLADSIVAARAIAGRRPDGVVICMASELHCAALVRKTDASRPGAFTSPGYGPLGYVSEGRCRLLLRAAAWPGPYILHDRPRPLVGLLVLAFDTSAAELEALLAAPLDGLVVAGLGAGTTPPVLDPLLAAAARRIPVVMATRSGQGEVAAGTYVGAGTTHNLLTQGVIAGGFLDPRKARILLTTLLWAGYSGDLLRKELTAWRELAV